MNTRRIMVNANQVRAARALLGWRQHDLALASKIGLATVQRIEKGSGIPAGYASTLHKVQSTLERAGIRFLEEDDAGGIGVRLEKRNAEGNIARR